jgi:hypothetical protein
VNIRLAALAARRTLHASVLVAIGLALWAALGSGAASGLAAEGGVTTGISRAGTWTESAWTAFLALVLPCFVFRAATLHSRGEAAWISVSRAAGWRGAATLAAGALVAALFLAAAWSGIVALGPDTPEPVPGLVDRTNGPAQPLVDHDHPLVWTSPVPAGSGLEARIEVSLAITAGGGGEVHFGARRVNSVGSTRADPRDPSSSSADSTSSPAAVGRAFVLPRGGVSVSVPGGEGDVEFELSLPEPGARGYTASEFVTLWRDEPACTPRSRMATRVALALGAWTLLAYGFGAWMAPLIALGCLASAWSAVWWSDAANGVQVAWLPGAGLAHDLALVAQGRAPTSVTPIEFGGALACALLGLALATLRAEKRP